MQFHELAANIIEGVYTDDLKSQEYYLKYIADARKVPMEYLKSIGAFFVPNDQYLLHYGGNEVLKKEHDLYFDGYCNWVHFLVIPVRSLSGKIYGFVGWDANNSLRKAQGEVDLPTYRTSNKRVFNKNNFFLTDAKVIEQTFQYKTIFVVDGVFDAISLNCRGIPTIALLGSSFSEKHLFFLHWFEHIYVITDNDEAGANLYRWLHRAIPRAVRIKQNKTKDIDDFIKEYPNQTISQLCELLEKPSKQSIVLNTKQ